jgi:acyl-CoA hydrolase
VSAYYTFVGVEEKLCPTEIAPVIPETEDEIRRYREADERRAARLRTKKN